VAAAQEHQQYYPYVTQGRHFAEVVLGGVAHPLSPMITDSHLLASGA